MNHNRNKVLFKTKIQQISINTFEGRFKALGGPRLCGNHCKLISILKTTHAKYEPIKTKHFRYVQITFRHLLYLSFWGLSALRAPRRGHAYHLRVCFVVPVENVCNNCTNIVFESLPIHKTYLTHIQIMPEACPNHVRIMPRKC